MSAEGQAVDWLTGKPPPERLPKERRVNYATQGQVAEQIARLAKATQAALRGERRSLLDKLEQRDLRIALLEQRLAALEQRLAALEQRLETD